MDLSRTVAVPQPRPVTGGRSLVALSIAALLAIGFVVEEVFPYLRLDPEALARYWPRRWWLLAHITAGTVALLTGPVQLWLGISRRAMRVHRRLGVAYVASVGAGSIAAFYLAAHTDLGWMFGAGITGLGIAWVVTTTMAVAAVRRGLIEQHQDWMIRSYVVTFAFVTFRVLWTLLQFAGVGTLREQLGVCSWFCWAAASAGHRGRAARAQDGWRPPARSAAALVLVLWPCPPSALAQARIDRRRSRRPRQGRVGRRSRGRRRHDRQRRDRCRPHNRDRPGRPVSRACAASRLLLDQASIDRASHPENRGGIVLLLGQSASVEFTMKLAAVEEGVNVLAETPVFDTGHTAVSSVVRQEQVQNLPINGRNFLSFSVMTPGVTTDRTPQQGATATSGLSFTGQRGRSNNIMVDGFDNNDPAVGAVRATFSQEAVREFQVLTNSYSAEFGKAAGGVVNIVTRSGTNEFRGTAFGYYRDEALNAKDHFERFDPFGNPLDREKAPFRQVQWGGVLGGPVRRPGRSSSARSSDWLSRPTTSSTSTLARRRYWARTDSRRARTRAVCRSARPTRSARSTISSRPRVRSSSARTSAGHERERRAVRRARGEKPRRRAASRRRVDRRSHTHVFGRVVNEARVQFARQDFAVQSLDPRCDGRCETDDGGGPTLELPGVASVGRQRFTPQLRKNDRYQLTETVSLAAGAHSLKAGIDLNYLDNRLAALPLHFGGRFIFAALPANPALGLSQPVSAVQALERGLPAAYIQGYGNPRYAFGQSDVSVFLQDDWRIGKRLVIKPGVRYQKQFWPDAPYDVSTVGGDRLQYDIRQGGSFAPGSRRPMTRRATAGPRFTPPMDAMTTTRSWRAW